MNTETKTRPAAATDTAKVKPTTKIATVTALLSREQGATLEELMQATGWQQHSVRGAMSGALTKRGLVISSDRIDGVRRYLAVRA